MDVELDSILNILLNTWNYLYNNGVYLTIGQTVIPITWGMMMLGIVLVDIITCLILKIFWG